jgi:hypothetical protein
LWTADKLADEPWLLQEIEKGLEMNSENAGLARHDCAYGAMPQSSPHRYQ